MNQEMNFLCSNCQNQTSKSSFHIILYKCDHVICENCIKDETTNKNPQENLVQINCKTCKLNLEYSVNFLQNERQRFKISTKFYCNQHTKNEILYFCNSDQQLLCKTCVIDHQNHNWKEFEKQDIVQQASNLKQDLNQMIQMIANAEAKLDKIINSNQNIDSVFIKETFAQSLHIKNNLPSGVGSKRCKVQQENVGQKRQRINSRPSRNSQMINPINLVKSQKTLFTAKLNNVKQQQDNIDLMGSQIIQTQDLQNKIMQLVNNKRLKQIFVASKYKFNAKYFHEFCDNKGPTLTIVKSRTHQKIFGGYTDISWQTGNSVIVEGNKNSFVFSVRENGNIEKFKCLKKEREVGHDKDAMVWFRGAFKISSYCNYFNHKTTSTFGKNNIYEIPQGMKKNSKEAEEYLAGKLVFNVEEMEVYQVL